jgi:2-keto-3-deoxy-L-rhamnonate aldolase RhmA
VLKLKNILKEKLRKGEAAVGVLIALGHPDVTELLSRAGFDFLYLDDEHGPMDYETLLQMMQAMNGTDCTPVVRVQWNDPTVIKRVLDIGAHGIIVPMVSTKEDAEKAVQACKYPPRGIRGYGPRRYALTDPDYLKTANDEVMVIAIIETGKGVENIEDILSVDGIDACLVGHFDLSLDQGLPIPPIMPPQKDNPGLAEALDKVIQASKKTGKVAGLAADINNIGWAIDRGFRLNLVGSVDKLLFDASRNVLDAARKAAERSNK